MNLREIDKLIAEKVEQLQKQLEQLKDEHRFRLKMLQKQEKDLMKVCEERDRLKQQLHQAQAKAEKYENALREIDTHIRSTSEPVSYIIQTLKETLPEYTEQALEG
jgi:conjugal transfer/entry exclusion protein